MLHASTQQLIRKLCELTEQGAIAWREGEADACLFETEGYVVEVKATPPAVRLLRQDGRELERADAGDLAAPWPGGEATYATKVGEMAHHAGRIARGAETAIAKILSSLSAPPKRLVELDPEPASLAFDLPVARAPSTEGASAIAAVSANLDAQRPGPINDPPVSHTLPEPAPVAVAAETETAIDRVLAVQPAPQPEPVIVIEPPSTRLVTAAADPEPRREPEPASAAPPNLIEPGPAEAAALEAGPDPVAASEPAPAAAEPAREAERPIGAFAAAARPEPAAQPILAAKAGFGSIDSFTRARPAPPPSPEQSKVTSTGLLMRGFSARTSQIVEPSVARDYMRSAIAEPQPKPVPAPAAQPAPAPEKKFEPASPTGADIYKPWA